MALDDITQKRLTNDDRAHLEELRLWLSDSSTSFSKSKEGISYCSDKDLGPKIANLANSLDIIVS